MPAARSSARKEVRRAIFPLFSPQAQCSRYRARLPEEFITASRVIDLERTTTVREANANDLLRNGGRTLSQTRLCPPERELLHILHDKIASSIGPADGQHGHHENASASVDFGRRCGQRKHPRKRRAFDAVRELMKTADPEDARSHEFRRLGDQQRDSRCVPSAWTRPSIVLPARADQPADRQPDLRELVDTRNSAGKRGLRIDRWNSRRQPGSAAVSDGARRLDEIIRMRFSGVTRTP